MRNDARGELYHIVWHFGVATWEKYFYDEE
jgi:hypothetical protein